MVLLVEAEWRLDAQHVLVGSVEGGQNTSVLHLLDDHVGLGVGGGQVLVAH